MVSRSAKVMSLSLARLVMSFTSVTSSMVFARYLSVEDYATYLQTFLAYDIAVPVLTLGLPSALYYFLPSHKGNEKGIVIDNMILLFFCGLLFTCFLFCGGTEILARRFDNPDLSHTLQWMYFYPLYTFPIVLGAILVIKDHVQLNAWYNVLTGFVLTIGIIVTAIFTRSYEAPILTRIIIPVFFFPLACYFSFKYVSGKWRFPSIISMWKILKFSVPLGIATVCGSITLQIANVIVSLMCTPEEFAVYANGAREIPLISIITGSISVVIMAEMSQKCKEGNKNEALELFQKAAVVSGCFLLPIMVLLFIFAADVIDFLYTSKYWGSTLPFRIYLFFLPIRIVMYGAAFIALGMSKAILYRSFVELILTIILCYFFVWWLGYRGAALAPIVTLYSWAIPYNMLTLGKAFGCKPKNVLPLKKLGKIWMLSLIAGGVACVCLIFCKPSFFRFLIGCLIGGSVYCILSYKYILEFKILFRNRINAIKKKL